MGPFFEVGPAKTEPGSLVRIPALYPNRDRLILDINVRADPSEQNLEAVIRPLAQRYVHVPVKSLNLASDELAFVVRGKIRPAVVLAGGQSKWATSPTEQIFICAPLFTVAKPAITQTFVVTVQALRYPGMFYMPESAMYHVEESVCRFDTIQVAHGSGVDPLMSGNKPVMLSTEFFGLLKSQLVQYLGGTIPTELKNELDAYGDIVLDEAKKLGVK